MDSNQDSQSYKEDNCEVVDIETSESSDGTSTEDIDENETDTPQEDLDDGTELDHKNLAQVLADFHDVLRDEVEEYTKEKQADKKSKRKTRKNKRRHRKDSEENFEPMYK